MVIMFGQTKTSLMSFSVACLLGRDSHVGARKPFS